MPIILKVPGAAAEAVLQVSGVKFAQASALRSTARVGTSFTTFPMTKQPPESVMAAANALDEARWAAMEACCAGWAEKPAYWQLECADDCGRHATAFGRATAHPLA